jgi:hypothetical protein
MLLGKLSFVVSLTIERVSAIIIANSRQLLFCAVTFWWLVSAHTLAGTSSLFRLCGQKGQNYE